MTLEELQRRFKEGLLTGSPAEELLDQISDPPTLDTRGRLEIYRGSYRANLRSTLESTYDVCRQVVGSDYFRQLSNAFIRDYPSTHANLDWYGKDFAFFIEHQSRQRTELQKIPYLVDLAQLEWCWHKTGLRNVLVTCDVAGALKGLGADVYERIAFILNPTLVVIESNYPVFSIWQMHRESGVIDQELDSIDTRESVLLWNNGTEVFCQLLDDDVSTLIGCLQCRLTLGELAQDEKLRLLMPLLSDLVASKVITGIVEPQTGMSLLANYLVNK